MPAPFGKRPTMQEYLDWARENGCKYGSGEDPSGLTMIRIEGPDGRVMYDVTPLDEHLSPSFVTYLDRRLGVTSPFDGAPDPT